MPHSFCRHWDQVDMRWGWMCFLLFAFHGILRFRKVCENVNYTTSLTLSFHFGGKKKTFTYVLTPVHAIAMQCWGIIIVRKLRMFWNPLIPAILNRKECAGIPEIREIRVILQGFLESKLFPELAKVRKTLCPAPRQCNYRNHITVSRPRRTILFKWRASDGMVVRDVGPKASGPGKTVCGCLWYTMALCGYRAGTDSFAESRDTGGHCEHFIVPSRVILTRQRGRRAGQTENCR